MTKTAIVVDSTCDLGPETLEKLGVKMVPLKVIFGEESFDDAIDISADEFYAKLKTVKELPTTSQPAPLEFISTFNACADEGYDDIVCLSISSGISGTYQGAVLASASSKIPVYCVDSKSVSLGLALLVDAAVKFRDRGLNAIQIAQRLEDIVSKLRLLFIIDSLDNLVKGGRAHKAAGLASALLDIKPILMLDEEGKIVPYKKFKGRSKAFVGMGAYIREYNEKEGPLYFAPLYTQDPQDAQRIRDCMIEAGVDAVELLTGQVGPAIGTHVPEAASVAIYPQELLDKE